MVKLVSLTGTFDVVGRLICIWLLLYGVLETIFVFFLIRPLILLIFVRHILWNLPVWQAFWCLFFGRLIFIFCLISLFVSNTILYFSFNHTFTFVCLLHKLELMIVLWARAYNFVINNTNVIVAFFMWFCSVQLHACCVLRYYNVM